ncbi:MAG: hypothetical protein JWN86_440 [Planctomycetota bacterium]|nr:hypothetical protein [Planctomycetota bacterium]
MSISTRLRAIERTIRPPKHDGIGFLILTPDSSIRPGVPRCSMVNAGTMNLYYPLDALDADGNLVASLESLVPPGPDHDRLVALARSARQTIEIHYPAEWRAS